MTTLLAPKTRPAKKFSTEESFFSYISPTVEELPATS
jgi:hypothetical protein